MAVEFVGVAEHLKKEITCPSCLSILRYAPIDVKNFHRGIDISGEADGSEGINCPKCDTRVVTRSW